MDGLAGTQLCEINNQVRVGCASNDIDIDIGFGPVVEARCPNFNGIRVPGEPLRLQSLFNMPLARLQSPS